jgi:hypothetical protein
MVESTRGNFYRTGGMAMDASLSETEESTQEVGNRANKTVWALFQTLKLIEFRRESGSVEKG